MKKVNLLKALLVLCLGLMFTGCETHQEPGKQNKKETQEQHSRHNHQHSM